MIIKDMGFSFDVEKTERRHKYIVSLRVLFETQQHRHTPQHYENDNEQNPTGDLGNRPVQNNGKFTVQQSVCPHTKSDHNKGFGIKTAQYGHYHTENRQQQQPQYHTAGTVAGKKIVAYPAYDIPGHPGQNSASGLIPVTAVQQSKKPEYPQRETADHHLHILTEFFYPGHHRQHRDHQDHKQQP